MTDQTTKSRQQTVCTASMQSRINTQEIIEFVTNLELNPGHSDWQQKSIFVVNLSDRGTVRQVAES